MFENEKFFIRLYARSSGLKYKFPHLEEIYPIDNYFTGGKEKVSRWPWWGRMLLWQFQSLSTD
jgi:hypothetical protein